MNKSAKCVCCGSHPTACRCNRYADSRDQRIATLEANQAAMLEALEPFARSSEEWGDDVSQDWFVDEGPLTITVGDLRKARAAVQQVKGGEG